MADTYFYISYTITDNGRYFLQIAWPGDNMYMSKIQLNLTKSSIYKKECRFPFKQMQK